MPSVIIGLLAIAVGLWTMTVWWWSVTELLRGLVPLVLLGFGVLALAAGVAKVRDDKEVSDEDLLGTEK